jgi:hypothetical protein
LWATRDGEAPEGFVFEIPWVLEIEEEVEIRHWRVMTRQGERRFQTRLDAWPRDLPGGGLLIRDLAGDLYRLAYAGGLDKKSGGCYGRLWTDTSGSQGKRRLRQRLDLWFDGSC